MIQESHWYSLVRESGKIHRGPESEQSDRGRSIREKMRKETEKEEPPMGVSSLWCVLTHSAKPTQCWVGVEKSVAKVASPRDSSSPRDKQACLCIPAVPLIVFLIARHSSLLTATVLSPTNTN